MSKYTIIKCGRLYTGRTDDVLTGMQILVEDDRIREVDKAVTAVPGAEWIDLSDAFVTPGLIDAHVHYSFTEWRTRMHDSVYEAPIYKGMYALHNARKSLAHGFTAVRHCGSNCDDDYSIVTAKRLIGEGHYDGCRMVVAPHYLSTTCGHGDYSKLMETNPVLADYIWQNYPGRGSGPDEFREVVRRQVKYGADFIKIFASGGFNSESDGPEMHTFTDEELKAIIDTAHMMHKKVSSHTYAPELVVKQVEMGIDCIEHGALIRDPAILTLMKDHGVHFVPTFTPYEGIIHPDEENIKSQTPGMQRKLRYYGDWLREAREVIVASDIDLGYGTDLVSVHYPYESGWEFYNMVRSGIAPLRALAGATRINAKILEMENDIGAVAPGYFADVAAWKRDPLTDPAALLDCAFCMKGGKVFKTEADI